MKNTLLIQNTRAVLPSGVTEPIGILLSDGKIQAIGYEGEADRVIDAAGGYLMAGFVDLHVHGGGGADFMDATTEAFACAVKAHLSHGTTLLYPTAMSASEADLAAFIFPSDSRLTFPISSIKLITFSKDGIPTAKIFPVSFLQ